MVRELMPNHTSEAFYRHLISQNVFEGPENPKKETNHCIVFCKKVAPNVFDITKGMAMVSGVDGYFSDGICMVAPATKVVFVFE